MSATMEKRRNSGLSAGTPNTKRKVTHVSKACDSCRRRKIKCDAQTPCCSGCIQYKEDCSYDGTSDRRKPVSRDYVVALEERVSFLERTLQQQGVETSPASEASYDSAPAKAATGSVASSQNRLQINALTGELGEYGPTSAFKHALNTDVHSDTQQQSDQAVGALEEEQLEAVIKLFFAYFNPWCSYIEQDLFTRDLLNPSLSYAVKAHRTAYYSPLLHHAVLSIGCRYLDGNREKLSMHHIEQAKLFVDFEVETPMLSTVAGLFVLSIALSGAGRQGLGWMYAGLGLRVALALGLGIDCSYCVGKLISEETKRSRDRLFYLAYISDKLWSFYVGRATSLSISDYETAIPGVNPVDDLRPWPAISQTSGADRLWEALFEEKAKVDIEPDSVNVPSLESTNFVWTCKLARVAEDVLDTAYSIRLDTWSDKVRQMVSQVESVPYPYQG